MKRQPQLLAGLDQIARVVCEAMVLTRNAARVYCYAATPIVRRLARKAAK
jgi:hypothetical protein